MGLGLTHWQSVQSRCQGHLNVVPEAVKPMKTVWSQLQTLIIVSNSDGFLYVDVNINAVFNVRLNKYLNNLCTVKITIPLILWALTFSENN